MKYNSKEVQCSECGGKMKLSVQVTCAPYAGFCCDSCGPYDRVSEYFQSKEEAQKFIDSRQEFKSYWEQ